MWGLRQLLAAAGNWKKETNIGDVTDEILASARIRIVPLLATWNGMTKKSVLATNFVKTQCCQIIRLLHFIVV